MRRSLLLLAGLLAIFSAARAAHVVFFSDIVPVGYADTPQSLWAVETTFLLQATEYVAAACIVLMLVIVARTWLRPTGK